MADASEFQTRNRLWLVALLWLVGCSRASADLNFAATEVAVLVRTGQSTLAGKFSFTNAGTVPVRIFAVIPSCGCTRAMFTKGELAAGKAGFIEWTYQAAANPTDKAIYLKVQTDEPGNRVYTLILQIRPPRN
jgi:xanthine/uracil/vitamin C permease (AzgA family)